MSGAPSHTSGDHSADVAALLALPGVTEDVVLAGPVGFLAFHGGLEGGTEVVASRAAEASGSSLYTIVQPAGVRWHLPSHIIGAGASDTLLEFLDHVDVTIAVHGYGRRDRPRDLMLGGRNRVLAASLGAALRAELPGWTVIDALEEVPQEMRGLHPSNPVNMCSHGGVQLELPPSVRGASGRWADDNSGAVPHAGLLTALANVAQSMSNVPPERQ